MMEPPAAEFTIICIDNGKTVFWKENLIKAQIDATKLYCQTVFKCNPNNIVTIFGMSSNFYCIVVHQTSDLEEIMSALEGLYCQPDGEARFQPTLSQACLDFSLSPRNMKRRLLMFVGSNIYLEPLEALSCGKKLKHCGVALDIFNFYYMEIDPSNEEMLRSRCHYPRIHLEELVDTVNDDGNSHFVDMYGKIKSSVLDTLCASTLQNHLRYLDQKAAADEENKSGADEKNKSDEAPQTQFVKPRMERFHSERTKTAAGHFRTDLKPKWIKKVETTKWIKKVETTKWIKKVENSKQELVS